MVKLLGPVRTQNFSHRKGGAATDTAAWVKLPGKMLECNNSQFSKGFVVVSVTKVMSEFF